MIFSKILTRFNRRKATLQDGTLGVGHAESPEERPAEAADVADQVASAALDTLVGASNLDPSILTALNKAARPRRGERGPMESYCEIQSGDAEWCRVTVDEALAIRSADKMVRVRCPACHGPVRLHKASRSGARAHPEHKERDKTCSAASPQR